MDIMLRLGELTLKSNRSRRRFLRRLINNVRDALDSNGFRYAIENLWSRIIVRVLGGDEKRAFDILRRVFGIHSLALIEIEEFRELGDIVKYGEELYRDVLRGRTFAIRARRTGRHAFRSMDIARDLGAALKKYSAGVDLSNPDITIYVEVRNRRVFFYTDIVDAYGGLPIGTEGRAVALVSGGFDSAVAAWYALRRGAEVHYVFCNLDGEAYKRDALRVIKVLADNWSYGYRPKVHIIDFDDVLREIRRTREDYWNILLKRMMYRAAEAVAEEIGADTIITGESLGQVSSQTMRNLRVSQLAIDLPVNRPLFGMDKEDIINISREIGTYNYSSKVQEYCAIVPEKPVLKASPETASEEEGKLDMEVLYRAIEDREVINIRGVEVEEDEDEFGIDYLPKDMKIIDIRREDEYEEWHAPGAIYVSMSDVLAEPDKYMTKDEKVLLYCDVGVTSKAVAEYLRSLGFKVYYFRYGVPKLKKICDEIAKKK